MSAALAADPSGTWKWTAMGMGGGARGGGEKAGGGEKGGGGGQRGTPRESTATLAMKDGTLTGSLSMPGRGGDPVTAQISDASYKDDTISFSVVRETQNGKITTKYMGKVEGDTIKGTMEVPGRDGETRKLDWTATRAK